MARRLENRRAAERFDVLEEELPRGTCSVKGCGRGQPLAAVGGAFGTFYVCSRHRPLYRMHNRILSRIRAL